MVLLRHFCGERPVFFEEAGEVVDRFKAELFGDVGD
jgi:hypothetical protein